MPHGRRAWRGALGGLMLWGACGSACLSVDAESQAPSDSSQLRSSGTAMITGELRYDGTPIDEPSSIPPKIWLDRHCVKTLKNWTTCKAESQALSVSPQSRSSGTGVITGELRYNGTPIDNLSPILPKLWVLDHRCMERLSNWTKCKADAESSVQKSRYTVTGLSPGLYELSVAIDANVDNPLGFAGDFQGDLWEVSIDAPGAVVHQDVALRRYIRLLEPVDSVQRLPFTVNDPTPSHHSPIRLAWEPVPGATEYRYDIAVFTKGKSGTQKYLSHATQNTFCVLELPPSRPGQSYMFHLSAFGPTGYLGEFWLRGSCVSQKDYRFVIRPPAESR